MSELATADFRQKRFKSLLYFVSENENFAQNPLILPTLFKALSASSCLCYRRQNVPRFAVSLSFKMKCMTHFLSLLSPWLIKIPFLKICVQMNDAKCNICFDLNLHSVTIQVKYASCVRSL